MLYIFTGNGKGKTTSALGQAMRAVGEGKRVLMVQFIKGPWKSGEDIFMENFQFSIPNFQIKKMGKGFVGILGDSLPIEEHKKAAENAFAFAKKETESGNWDIIILDEINNAVHLNLISKESVLDFLQAANRKSRRGVGTPTSLSENSSSASGLLTIILTGRDAPQEFIERADLVTEMVDKKHPYEQGIKGRRGLEY